MAIKTALSSRSIATSISSISLDQLLTAIWTITHFCVFALTSLIYLPSALEIYFFHSSKLENYNLPDSYALVTGASDGIGLAFVSELATAGWNVVIHGRSSAKLESAAACLRKTYPHQHFRTLVADATAMHDFDTLLAPLKELRITLLVNNVGGGVDMVELPFMEAERVDHVLSSNVFFSIRLTHALLSKAMLVCGHSCIINTSSCTAVLPARTGTVYSASKAFMIQFSSCLRAEDLGIEIMTVNLGLVHSASCTVRLENSLIVTAQEFARQTLDKVGLGWRYEVIWPCIGHGILWGWLCSFCLPKRAAAEVWEWFFAWVLTNL